MLSICLTLLQNSEDEPIFEEFYNKYNKLVYYIARSHLNNHQLAEETVQETFIRFAKIFHNIKPSYYDDNIEGLVKTIARNVSIDFYRKRERIQKNVVDADLTDFYSLSDDDFEICNQVILKQAIDDLPEEIKSVFYLKYVYGYSGAEIAELLSISESLVRKRCMIGRQMVKKIIESDSND